jgi:hypothetical protein
MCSSDNIPYSAELVLKVSTRTRDTIIFADTEYACDHGETCRMGRCSLKGR